MKLNSTTVILVAGAVKGKCEPSSEVFTVGMAPTTRPGPVIPLCIGVHPVGERLQCCKNGFEGV